VEKVLYAKSADFVWEVAGKKGDHHEFGAWMRCESANSL